MSQHWNGDEWRWHVGWHPRPTTQTIQVIEQPAGGGDETSPEPRRRVAFGFGAREPVVEPLLWEGDGA